MNNNDWNKIKGIKISSINTKNNILYSDKYYTKKNRYGYD